MGTGSEGWFDSQKIIAQRPRKARISKILSIYSPEKPFMNNLFEIAEACLHHPNIDEKLALTHHAKFLFDTEQLDFKSNNPVQPI
jgi:hypothetical protein